MPYLLAAYEARVVELMLFHEESKAAKPQVDQCHMVFPVSGEGCLPNAAPGVLHLRRWFFLTAT